MAWRAAMTAKWTDVLRKAHVPEPGESARFICEAAKSLAQARQWAGRRLKHEPLQYILGTQPFYKHEIRVRRPVFIPRPETEFLCELLIRRFQGRTVRLLEIGCGSGAIAVTLCKHLDATGIAIDSDMRAVQLAQQNARRILGEDFQQKLTVLHRDFYSYSPEESFDLVVSNPPYIPSARLRHLERQVLRYESRLALDGGEGGRKMIEKLMDTHWLKTNGEMWIEVDCSYIEQIPWEKTRDCFGRLRFVHKTHLAT